MDKERVIICIDCKRELLATTENFNELKKSKYGLNNVCKDCQEARKWRGIGSKWRKRATGKYLKPPNQNNPNKP